MHRCVGPNVTTLTTLDSEMMDCDPCCYYSCVVMMKTERCVWQTWPWTPPRVLTAVRRWFPPLCCCWSQERGTWRPGGSKQRQWDSIWHCDWVWMVSVCSVVCVCVVSIYNLCVWMVSVIVCVCAIGWYVFYSVCVCVDGKCLL